MVKVIPHLYGEIVRIESTGTGFDVSISDGSVLHMPGVAQVTVNRMQQGDRILIDLEKWEVEGRATVAFLREGQCVTSCEIGKGTCELSLASS